MSTSAGESVSLANFFFDVPMSVPDLSGSEIKELNVAFLKLVLKVGKADDKVPLKKFMLFYDNVMPERYRFKPARLGGLVRAVFGEKKKDLKGYFESSQDTDPASEEGDEEVDEEEGDAPRKRQKKSDSFTISTKNGKLYRNGGSYWKGFSGLTVLHELQTKSNAIESKRIVLLFLSSSFLSSFFFCICLFSEFSL